jgi:WhiB family redox-sensing transcriptional regulator
MSRSQGKAFLQLVVPTPDSEDKPACANVEPELFFPSYTTEEGAHTEALAKAVCARCPISFQCLEFAFHTGDKWAILGGKTPAEREAMRRTKAWKQEQEPMALRDAA